MHELSNLHEQEPPTEWNSAAWRTWDEAYSEEHRIIQVGIERTICYGESSVYSAILHANGQVKYQGDMHVDLLGEHFGKLNEHDFRALAQFIAGTQFWKMESEYDFQNKIVTDFPSTYVLVATTDRRKIVKNYADSGPPELWAIAGLIDFLLQSVEWE
jgi:hypothetical protein